MKMYRNTNDFTRNQVQLGMTFRKFSAATFGNGRSHPPKNSVVATDETTIMFAYSARKNSANANHTRALYCAFTMPTMLSVPATRMTLTSVSVTATSYEISCADARRLASKGNLLFEA